VCISGGRDLNLLFLFESDSVPYFDAVSFVLKERGGMHSKNRVQTTRYYTTLRWYYTCITLVFYVYCGPRKLHFGQIWAENGIAFTCITRNTGFEGTPRERVYSSVLTFSLKFSQI